MDDLQANEGQHKSTASDTKCHKKQEKRQIIGPNFEHIINTFTEICSLSDHICCAGTLTGQL